jgi:hypothetical protein
LRELDAFFALPAPSLAVKQLAGLITSFAQNSFTTETLIRLLAPSAVEMKRLPVPADHVYYRLEEKVVILKTRDPKLAMCWWFRPPDKEEVIELHIKSVPATVPFKDFHDYFQKKISVVDQTHSLSDLQHHYQIEREGVSPYELIVNEIMFADGPLATGKIGELTIKKTSGVLRIMEEKILELCAEEDYEFWELAEALGIQSSERTKVETFGKKVAELVDRKMIVAKRKNPAKRKLEPIEFNREELIAQIKKSDQPNPNSDYWFGLKNGESV